MDAGAFIAFFRLISDTANSMVADSNILLIFGITLGLAVVGGIFSIVRR